MVCVVTHLKELAERLPARVEVHASESGSTLEVIYT
jgi:DNA repair exonuclease SbcCD ATPase subunit